MEDLWDAAAAADFLSEDLEPIYTLRSFVERGSSWIPASPTILDMFVFEVIADLPSLLDFCYISVYAFAAAIAVATGGTSGVSI